MLAPGAEIPRAYENLPPYAPQDDMTGQEAGYPQSGQNPIQIALPVVANAFTRTLYKTLGLSIAQVRV